MVDFKGRVNSVFENIPNKANKVLEVVLLLILIIFLRIWHLSVFQHEQKIKESRHPRRKIVYEPALRGTIRDRNNNILATNRAQFRVSFIFSDCRRIRPFYRTENGKGVVNRRMLRKEYIESFSKMLAKELGEDPKNIEDRIWSYSVALDTIPYIIKDGISEETFYRLKFIEKDWPGLVVETRPERYYPHGKLGCHVLGYVGRMQKEYFSELAKERDALRQFVQACEEGEISAFEGEFSFSEAKKRLLELEEQSYLMSDEIGIFGVEKYFERDLRGYFGKKVSFIDARGTRLYDLPGSYSARSGKRVLLTLSIELQKFAEKLLLQSELDREKVHQAFGGKEGEPWTRGGAIVALVPNTGEIVALASTPRFDPNDFVVAKRDTLAQEQTNRWLASDEYIAKVWTNEALLKREACNNEDNFEENKELTWNLFLEILTPKKSWIREELSNTGTIGKILDLQKYLLNASASSNKSIPGFIHDFWSNKTAYKSAYFTHMREKCSSWKEFLLFCDIARLVVIYQDVDSQIERYIRPLSIQKFRELASTYIQLIKKLREKTFTIWKKTFFEMWQEQHQKDFLKQMRDDEKREKLRPKPYYEYIEQKKNELFNYFWTINCHNILQEVLYSQSINQEETLFDGQCITFHELRELFNEKQKKLCDQFFAWAHTFSRSDSRFIFQLFRSFFELDWPLFSQSNKTNMQTGQDLVRFAVRKTGLSSLRSFAYRELSPQGSIFKLVTAYTALMQAYQNNPSLTEAQAKLFQIEDFVYKKDGKVFVGNDANGRPLPQLYKGGRIPKSLRANIGKIDLVSAIEYSSNPYFSLLAAEYIKEPSALIEIAKKFGYSSKTYVELPFEARGRLPNDLETNKTGVYSVAIGQHTLLCTPLQSARFLQLLACPEKAITPSILRILVGYNSKYTPTILERRPHFVYQKELNSIGIDFPLFVQTEVQSEQVHHMRKIERGSEKIIFPRVVRKTIYHGMTRVVEKLCEDKGGVLGYLYSRHPKMKEDLLSLKDRMLGKSSTAEIQEKIGFDVGQTSVIFNHTWFGGIAYQTPEKKSPSLVVIVFLPYGGYGKEAAPIAAQIVRKWEEIQSKDQKMVDN